MANYLVTGGAGFIGSHIAERLVRDGHRVTVLDNFCAGRRENLADFIDKIELVEGDIRDEKILAEIMPEIDFISHQAALRSVPKSVEDPLSYDEVNVRGTLNVLLAAREAKVKRMVFASSSSIYGDSEEFPQKESQEPKVISPYAASKLAGEGYCRVFSKVYGLETVSLRYFNVYGPRQDPSSQYAAVIPIFIMRMLEGQSPLVHGDGRQSRDFNFVDNVADVNLLASRREGIAGEVFNVAGGCCYSVLDIVKSLNKLMDTDISPEFTRPRPGDVEKTWADMAKINTLMGYEPRVMFEEGLKQTLEFFRK